MRTYLFAYLGGLLASLPAFTLFNEVGASPYRNFDAVMNVIGGSLVSIVVYFLLLWVVPAFGAAIGGKLGGRGAGFRYIYNRGIGGQVLFSIGFTVLMMTVPSVGDAVYAMPATTQTVVFLMAAQVGCALGVVWG
ncbi:MAG: hypothetical protein ACE5GO_03000 [Anaerolineales bacterium]